MGQCSNSTRDQEYRVAINLKEINVGTKEKSPKLALTVKLHEGQNSTYHRLDYIWMERFFFQAAMPDNLTWKQVIKIKIIWRKM